MKQNKAAVFICLFAFNSLEVHGQLNNNTSDPYLAKQKEECATRPNKYWDNARARCVEKIENKEMRAEAKAVGEQCLKITDLEERKKCFVEHAKTKTEGMESDPKESGLKGAERVIGMAYSVISLIQMLGKESGKSNCTSKTIFGITSLAGTVSDIYLKIQAKKKLKELQDKYQIDVNTKSYDAQVKALEYLKEEQDTLAGIAAQEKKRHMLMMAGFGASLGFALYEMATMTPSCGPKTESAPTTPEKPTPAVANNNPAPAPAPAPAPPGPNPDGVEVNPVHRGDVNGTPLEPLKADNFENEIALHGSGPDNGYVIPPDPPAATAPAAAPTASVTRYEGANGKVYVNGDVGGQPVDFVGNKVYPQGSNKAIGVVEGNTIKITSGTNTGKTYQMPDSISTVTKAPRTYQPQSSSTTSLASYKWPK